MSYDVYTIIRYIHVICGSGWFGEVVVINFILIPVLSKYQGPTRKEFLNTIFPRVFNLASVLSATTAITGSLLLYHFIGTDLSLLFKRGTWGWSIFIAGSLGLVLTLFHFFIENHLARRVGVGKDSISPEAVEDVHLKLRFFPRLGMIVITTIFILMLNATHVIFEF